ncbi:hypothetical protein GUITHDRAFT_154028 [Guillardia theta CCMP2712]|uniref:PH domain-containing protein n=2 Tax=Geminigeraceae TaxID=589343 RepID=L1IYA8_GUITC|nr:hypothetical protein GUITHDRAFT_154028 [Guillardia theta CCMP2712]EKX40869.1 hypothetical protein GUITHDRAFT_154028 [Guillardia theta CCMP2712]|mmetsp:Transcript_47455/g.148439  ORF Transcript_47455/g.148439 Transcript_47455/m.148439 type:complete len:140 (-) Transcript_47455:452-871(-)|eukprot:XP_005827849.1 hypothetical protein GUITHDRAFT_154028 [Guillardia theta CCMP2712]
MGCCSSRAPGQHEWQANVPGSYKQNPVPVVNRKQEVPPDFFQKCFMKGYLKTLPKKQKIWCMIHENNFYFMDNQDDTEPRKFFCFDGCLVNLKGKELEIQTAELMGGSVPRATYKFVADDEEKALEWYEAALKASSRRN